MELRHLRHVITLSKHLHFKKAADELGLTQPALSRSIQLTEERYGAKLFDRDRGGVRLTPLGCLFVERAAALMREAADFERITLRHFRGMEGSVAFGVSPSTARGCLSMLLGKLSIERPHVTVNVAVRRTSALLPMFIAGEIEFLVCTRNEVQALDNSVFHSFGHFETCYLVRPDHPLLKDERLEVADFPIISTGPFRGNDRVMTGIFNLFDGQPQMTVESPDALARIAQQTDAVWLSSTFGAAEEIAGGALVRLPRALSGAGRTVEVGVYSSRHYTPSPIAKEITERLQSIFMPYSREE